MSVIMISSFTYNTRNYPMENPLDTLMAVLLNILVLLAAGWFPRVCYARSNLTAAHLFFPGCGGIINLRAGESTTFTSPGYPSSHGNKRCAWLINAPQDYLVEILFDEFDIATNGQMCGHNVEVRNNLLGQRGDL